MIAGTNSFDVTTMGTYKYINIKHLEALAEGNNEFVMELINMFTKQVPLFAEQLDMHLANGDLVALAKLSHKIKGSAATMGFKQLVKNMKELEELANQNTQTQRYSELIDKYKQLTTEIVEELKDYIHRYKLDES